uniref:Uncharacterized protein n=1 Tax=Leersia perrieri TaxID=77586 RepID=A0A0D9XA30_9ORYZ
MSIHGEIRLLAFHPDMVDVVYLSSSAAAAAAEAAVREVVARCDMRKKEIVRSWKVVDGHHVVRFWLLGFSLGFLNYMGGEQECQIATTS